MKFPHNHVWNTDCYYNADIQGKFYASLNLILTYLDIARSASGFQNVFLGLSMSLSKLARVKFIVQRQVNMFIFCQFL